MSSYILIFFGAVVVGAGILLFCSSCRLWLNEHKEAITVVAGLLGAGYVLVEYLEAQDQKRLKEALAYVHRGQSGEVASARAWLDRHVMSNKDEYDEASKKSPQEAELALKALEEKATNDPDGQKAIMTMFYFYADFSTCVELEICDDLTLCQNFSEDMRAHFGRYYDFLVDWLEETMRERYDRITNFLKSCPAGMAS